MWDSGEGRKRKKTSQPHYNNMQESTSYSYTHSSAPNLDRYSPSDIFADSDSGHEDSGNYYNRRNEEVKYRRDSSDRGGSRRTGPRRKPKQNSYERDPANFQRNHNDINEPHYAGKPVNYQQEEFSHFKKQKSNPKSHRKEQDYSLTQGDINPWMSGNFLPQATQPGSINPYQPMEFQNQPGNSAHFQNQNVGKARKFQPPTFSQTGNTFNVKKNRKHPINNPNNPKFQNSNRNYPANKFQLVPKPKVNPYKFDKQVFAKSQSVSGMQGKFPKPPANIGMPGHVANKKLGVYTPYMAKPSGSRPPGKKGMPWPATKPSGNTSKLWHAVSNPNHHAKRKRLPKPGPSNLPKPHVSGKLQGPPHLRVGIVYKSSLIRKLPPDVLSTAMAELTKALDATLMNSDAKKPTFKGISSLNEMININCADEWSVEWLKETVANLPDLPLVAMRSDECQNVFRVSFWVVTENDPIELVQKRLIAQNSDINMDKWTLVHNFLVKKRMRLMFLAKEADVKTVIQNGNQIHYTFDTLHVKIDKIFDVDEENIKNVDTSPNKSATEAIANNGEGGTAAEENEVNDEKNVLNSNNEPNQDQIKTVVSEDSVNCNNGNDTQEDPVQNEMKTGDSLNSNNGDETQEKMSINDVIDLEDLFNCDDSDECENEADEEKNIENDISSDKVIEKNEQQEDNVKSNENNPEAEAKLSEEKTDSKMVEPKDTTD